MDKKIIAVFKTHFDIGFTGLIDEVLKKYSNEMLKNVITTCESTQHLGKGLEYVWTMPAWPLIKCLSLAGDEDRKKAEELILRGQIVAHALPYTMHTESASITDLIYGMSLAKRFAKKFGKPCPVSAKMTDVPGHTLYLASLLCKSGVKFLHLGCNPASMPPDVPLLFWYECTDGKRVLVMYNKGSYGSSTLPPPDWKFPVWLAMKQTNDNHGPQSATIIEELQKEIGGKATLQVGTMDDFYYELSKYDLSALPVIKQDMSDTWVHGLATYPKEFGNLRVARDKLNTLKKLDTYFNQINQKSELKLLEDSLDNSLLFSEHTWGLSVIATLGHNRKYEKEQFVKERNEERYRRIEKSWQEQRDRAETVVKNVNVMEAELCGHLGKLGDNGKIVVFNPNGSPFSGFIEVGNLKGNEVLNNYPCHIIGEKTFIYDENIPPFSHKTLNPNAICKSNILIERNDCLVLYDENLRLEVNKTSGLVTLFYKNTKILSDSGTFEYNIIGSEQMTQYIKDYSYRFYDWAIQDFARSLYPEIESKLFNSKCCGVWQGKNSIFVKLETCEESYKRFGNFKNISFEYALINNALNIKVNLIGKEATPFLESGNIVFSFAKEPQYFINKVGQLIDCKKEIFKNAQKTFFTCEHYMQAEFDEVEARVISHHVPLFSVGTDGSYRWTNEFKSNKRLLSNLFNNMWGTNFPQYFEGFYSFEYDITFDEISTTQAISKPLISNGNHSELTPKQLISLKNAELYSSSVEEGNVYYIIRNNSYNQVVATILGRMNEAFEVDFENNIVLPLQKTQDGFLVELKNSEVKKILIK